MIFYTLLPFLMVQCAALYVGTAWYPEQFPISAYDQDLDMMKDAGIKVIRLAEFSWSTLEPSEGNYDFSWLDAAINKASARGFKLVLGTPTSSAPEWVTEKYPDTLFVNSSFVRQRHGSREQYNYRSEKYLELGRKVVTQMARRYANNTNVIGWQIDNELKNPSFDPSTLEQWASWLEDEYSTIDNLNSKWTTSYWSQTYQNFSQIPPGINLGEGQNPGLMLDWARFTSDGYHDYVANQVSVIRNFTKAQNSSQFITTNALQDLSTNNYFNPLSVYDQLDLAAWDDYVYPTDDYNYDWVGNAFKHDTVRGYKEGKNFWVMETMPPFVDWQDENLPLSPQAMRTFAWQAVGKGSDAILYWQWRSAANGEETTHGSLVGIDNHTTPSYYEVQKIAKEFEQASSAIDGSSVKANVALINDFTDRVALSTQSQNKRFIPLNVSQNFYNPLLKHAQVVDIISTSQPFDSYELIVAPSLFVLPQNLSDRLEKYIRNGGHLVLGPRSGSKDEYSRLNPQGQPGPLADTLGSKVDLWFSISKANASLSSSSNSYLSGGNATIWSDKLNVKTNDTEIVLTYDEFNGWCDNTPAVVTRPVGKGRITYVGTILDEDTIEALTTSWLAETSVSGVPVSDDIEFTVREKSGKKVYIIINHGKYTRQVPLKQSLTSVLTNTTTNNTVKLQPYGVEVLV